MKKLQHTCYSLSFYKSFIIAAIIAVSGLVAISAFAQSAEYARATVHLENKGLQELGALGIPIDHGEYIPNQSYTSDFSYFEIQQIRNAGFAVSIETEDVVRHYREQKAHQQYANLRSYEALHNCMSIAPDYPTPPGLTLGSMGGYYTYTEMLAHLDSMSAKFPNLITARQPIDTATTWEGRKIWYLKISDNPQLSEPEPEVLFTALHHAREPASLSQMIFFMYYLLENYQSDEQVTALIDNTEMYFIPCVNPDGYVYNETIEPNGGGLWRKNRRPNPDGTFGVDLNRNYGYLWGYDNNGSSPNMNSNVYRGPAPFSEPETEMVKNFCIQHTFKMAFNYHSYGELMIFPFGYQHSTQTADSNFFFQQGKLTTRANEYIFGTGDQTVGYIVNGSSDDWMYGDTLQKQAIYSFTPEVGPGQWGFWPPANAIVDLCKQQVFQNLWMVAAVLNQGTVSEIGSAVIIDSISELKLLLRKTGLQQGGFFIVRLSSPDLSILIIDDSIMVSGLSLLDDTILTPRFQVLPAVEPPTQVTFIVTLENGYFHSSDTINKTYALPRVVFADSANHTNAWNIIGNWGTEVVAGGNGPVFSDSPNGVNGPNESNELLLKPQHAINLENALYAELTFRTKWAYETRVDFGKVVVSMDNGTYWQPVCGNFTHPGGKFQDLRNPVYDRFQDEWVEETIDLSQFLGEDEILIGFFSETNDSIFNDGFLIDDVQVAIVEPLPVISGSESSVPALSVLQNTPNPAINQTTISYTIPPHGPPPEFVLTNHLGQEILIKPIRNSRQGKLTITIHPLPSGVYFYFIRRESLQSRVKKMVILDN